MKKQKILVIDYGVGNHQSVTNALNFLGYDFVVSGKKEDIVKAQYYIFPGVGAFGEAMKNLYSLGIIDCLQKEVLVKKKPILGICLGMQLLAEDSQENGYNKGLGWIKGHVVGLNKNNKFKIPHVGWNNVEVLIKEPLFSRSTVNAHYYFDHSFHFVCDEKYISAACRHGSRVVAAVQKDNIFGVQFHPEKSQNNGLRLIKDFLNI